MSRMSSRDGKKWKRRRSTTIMRKKQNRRRPMIGRMRRNPMGLLIKRKTKRRVLGMGMMIFWATNRHTKVRRMSTSMVSK